VDNHLTPEGGTTEGEFAFSPLLVFSPTKQEVLLKLVGENTNKGEGKNTSKGGNCNKK
jgi:hypothetical protein